MEEQDNNQKNSRRGFLKKGIALGALSATALAIASFQKEDVEETGEKVIQLLFQLNKEAGTTLVIITHDLELANRTQQILRLKGGKIVSNEKTLSV